MQAAFRRLAARMNESVESVSIRPAVEVVPKLGAKPGLPALRVGGVDAYDRPTEHLAGQLDVVDLRTPLRAKAARYGLVLCFALEAIGMERLASELARVVHPEGAVWVAVWKRKFERDGAPSWEEAQSAMLGTGLVDNKVLSLGERIYASRFVHRRRPPRREPASVSRRS
jgi:hypothetical protein